MTDTPNPLTELGHRVALARKRRGLKQTDLARRMGSTARTLYRLERGDGTVSLALLLRALEVLELDRDLNLIAADDAVGVWAGTAAVPKRVRVKNKPRST